MGSVSIKLEKISKRYRSLDGNRTVLESVTLTIKEGQRVAIVGPNGSGKSTFLQIALGLTKPDVGSVNWSHGNLFSETSYIPQDYRNSLFPWLRLSSNIALHLESQNRIAFGFGLNPSSETLNKFIQAASDIQMRFDLAKYPYQLSGGEQQIFALLQAMLKKPNLLVVDEPFSAIDIHKKEIIIQYLSNWLFKTKPTALIVSHELSDAVFLADRLVVFSRNSGEIRADITVEKEHPRTNEWRFGAEFRSILEKTMEAFE
ncbi:MAG: ABC transporter ATP-binding protein [Candidatus Omnitrophota bacterium]